MQRCCTETAEAELRLRCKRRDESRQEQVVDQLNGMLTKEYFPLVAVINKCSSNSSRSLSMFNSGSQCVSFPHVEKLLTLTAKSCAENILMSYKVPTSEPNYAAAAG